MRASVLVLLAAMSTPPAWGAGCPAARSWMPVLESISAWTQQGGRGNPAAAEPMLARLGEVLLLPGPLRDATLAPLIGALEASAEAQRRQEALLMIAQLRGAQFSEAMSVLKDARARAAGLAAAAADRAAETGSSEELAALDWSVRLYATSHPGDLASARLRASAGRARALITGRAATGTMADAAADPAWTQRLLSDYGQAFEDGRELPMEEWIRRWHGLLSRPEYQGRERLAAAVLRAGPRHDPQATEKRWRDRFYREYEAHHWAHADDSPAKREAAMASFLSRQRREPGELVQLLLRRPRLVVASGAIFQEELAKAARTLEWGESGGVNLEQLTEGFLRYTHEAEIHFEKLQGEDLRLSVAGAAGSREFKEHYLTRRGVGFLAFLDQQKALNRFATGGERLRAYHDFRRRAGLKDTRALRDAIQSAIEKEISRRTHTEIRVKPSGHERGEASEEEISKRQGGAFWAIARIKGDIQNPVSFEIPRDRLPQVT
ncbi:MAG: hypothetical protein HYZ74_01075, partial [Elusimicrobia bacterium]|nr:hypothetical protein [Elusimicrobiota bacterium]